MSADTILAARLFTEARIGVAYDLARANCWHLVADCQRTVFHRDVPLFGRRIASTRRTRLAAAALADITGWRETDKPEHGAVALLARPGTPPDIHAGIVLALQPFAPAFHLVLHTDHPHGVVLDDAAALALRGWTRRRFFVPDL